MGVDLGPVRPPCTCTLSYYYATHRMELPCFSLKSTDIIARSNWKLNMYVLVDRPALELCRVDVFSPCPGSHGPWPVGRDVPLMVMPYLSSQGIACRYARPTNLRHN